MYTAQTAPAILSKNYAGICNFFSIFILFWGPLNPLRAVTDLHIPTSKNCIRSWKTQFILGHIDTPIDLGFYYLHDFTIFEILRLNTSLNQNFTNLKHRRIWISSINSLTRYESLFPNAFLALCVFFFKLFGIV